MTGLSPEMIADSFVSLASLIGLLLFGQVLRGQTPRPAITRRFGFAIQVIAVIMAARLLQWFTGWEWIGRLTFIAASLVPLAALLVVEALLRRHSPVAVKVWAAGGAALFSLVALFVRQGHATAALLALAAFQALTFAALAGLVIWRDRASLSTAENATINRLALSLAPILPFALTDFRTGWIDLPVRLSGIAILVLCWLGLSLRRGGATQSDIFASATAFALGLLAAAVSIAALAQLDMRTTVQVMAVILSAGLLALVYSQARRIRRQDRSGQIMDVLADPQITTHADFLCALQTRALTDGALILDADGLEDFDTSFRDHFARHPMVGACDLGQMSNPDVAEQFDWFFRKFDASHAMLVSRAPFRVMALKVPALAHSAQLEQELSTAQRIALLLTERNRRDG